MDNLLLRIWERKLGMLETMLWEYNLQYRVVGGTEWSYLNGGAACPGAETWDAGDYAVGVQPLQSGWRD